MHRHVRMWWVIGWLVAFTVLLIFYWSDLQKALSSKPPAPQPAAETKKIENAGQDRLPGRWMRSDGGYVIEIREASFDGKLNAAYFNPNPINVARAEWQLKNEKLLVEVELRDVNYPGSLYTLEFEVAKDRLIGTYYQAVEGTTFDVEFTRE